MSSHDLAIESAAGMLRTRRDEASPRVSAQLTLLDGLRFIELARLAGLIPEEPGPTRQDTTEYGDSSEAHYLQEQLHQQVNKMICELIRHAADVIDATPMHRLPALANTSIAQEGRIGDDYAASVFALQQVFPTRLDGWLTIPKTAIGTTTRQREDAGIAVHLRCNQEDEPARVFEAAIQRDPEALADHLSRYLDSLRNKNGVLPIVVRDQRHLRHLRELEYFQIESAFQGVAKCDLVERGQLKRLTELITSLEGRAIANGSRSAVPPDLDQVRPLAVLWSHALRVRAGLSFIRDGQNASHRLEDNESECCPPLTIADIRRLGITLTVAETQCAIAYLRALPPNSFVEILDHSTILRNRRGRVGVPLQDWLLGVKDVFAAGPTTGGSAILDPYVAQFEATVVRRLREAGCLIIGKTNLDEFALGSSSETSAFKPTPGCPADRLRVAGGSSGGSASAVASGLVRLALGSDTAGSIRVPAAYCGVVGWKPSYGAVSRFGLLSLSSGLDVVGLLSRDMDDCIAAAGIIMGEDSADETTAGAQALDVDSVLRMSCETRSLKVGVPIEYFLNLSRPLLPIYESLVGTQEWERLRDFPARLAQHSDSASIEEDVPGALDDRFRTIPDYWDLFRSILDRIAVLGWTWKLVSLPHTWLSIPAYFAFSRAELASSLHRYDGTGFGARATCAFKELKSRARLSETRRTYFGIQPKLRILMGIHALQLPLVIKKYTDEERAEECQLDDFLELAKRARRAIHDDFVRVFRDVDVLLTPVVNVAAPPYGGIVDTVAQQRLDELTVPANHAGVPAVSLPWGTVRSLDEALSGTGGSESPPRLPAAVQVIAPRFEDARLLAAARRLERLREDGPFVAQAR